MKIIFTHGYFIAEDPKEQAIMKPYPPLGLLYISAWLEKHGYDNEVYDTTFSDVKSQRDYLLQNPPEVLAIYTNLMTKIQIVNLVNFIKTNKKFSDTLVVIGGPDVTYNLQNYLGTGADVLVIGEGEQTMLDLVKAREQGFMKQFGHIDGVAFLDEQGDVVKTNKRSHLRPVSQLPLPNRKKIDLHKYLETWKKHHGRSAVSVSTQRGCPYTCRWCSTAVYGQSYRRRPVESVVAELIELKKTYNPDQIWFVDDVFTVSHKWLMAFRDELRKNNIQIPFECISRADRMNEEVIKILKESGCFRVWIGAESGSQRILDAMDRRVKTEQVSDMIQATQQAGMEAGTFIMLGYPGETMEDIKETLNHLQRSNPTHFTITTAYPIKGTSLFTEIERDITERPDWNQSTDREIDFKRTYPRKFYPYATNWVVNSMKWYQMQQNNQHLSWKGFKTYMKINLSRIAMHRYL